MVGGVHAPAAAAVVVSVSSWGVEVAGYSDLVLVALCNKHEITACIYLGCNTIPELTFQSDLLISFN